MPNATPNLQLPPRMFYYRLIIGLGSQPCVCEQLAQGCYVTVIMRSCGRCSTQTVTATTIVVIVDRIKMVTFSSTDVARIFSGVHFFLEIVDDPF